MNERHRGLSINPVQREWTMAPGPRAPQVMCRRSHSRRRCNSSDSSSFCQPSPLSKWLRADSHSPVRRSCSQDDCWRSPGPRRLRASHSCHASHRSHSPTSHSQRRRSRHRSALSCRPSLADMTRRHDQQTSPECLPVAQAPFSLVPGVAITPGPWYVPSHQADVP